MSTADEINAARIAEIDAAATATHAAEAAVKAAETAAQTAIIADIRAELDALVVTNAARFAEWEARLIALGQQ